MSLRTKTRRRLTILLSIAATLTVIAGTGAGIRLAFLRRAALRGRTDGLSAMDRGDYATALQQLGRYLSRYPNDADVLLPYAKARRLVEEPQGANLGHAIFLYQRVLELHPNLPEARNDLLDLYVAVGFNTEAISLADNILADSANNKTALIHALRSKSAAMIRLQRLDDAQATLQRWEALAPLDMEVRIDEMQIMLKKGKPEQVLEYAAQLAVAHPADDRFQLLRSIAASLVGDSKNAIAYVKPLVTHRPIDTAYTRLLIRQLDNVGLFSDSFEIIRGAAAVDSDPAISHLWYRRLFETGRFPELLAETKSVNPSIAGSDIEPAGLRALALARTNRAGDATEIAVALEKRGESEPLAAAWAAALNAVISPDSSDPIKTIALLKRGLGQSDATPILVEKLGDAYADAGAGDKANATWQEAIRLAPEWDAPLVRISRTLINDSRISDALAAAQAALLRAPQDHDAVFAVALAMSASVPEGPSPEAASLLARLDEIKKQYPEDEDVLPLKVRVLAQSKNNDAAIAAIHEAIASVPPPSQRTLLSFAQTSALFHLDLEQSCWAASEKAHGLTPILAFARATWIHDHQQGPAALALIDQTHVDHPDDKTWRHMRAKYLDLVDDPRALSEWTSLADENPSDVKLQWSVISAHSVQANYELVGKTIDRLTDLLGRDSLTLRMLKARWYLNGKSAAKDIAEASILAGEVSREAPDQLAPRLLLATCYMRMGNIGLAIDQLTAASDIRPDLSSLAVEVAYVLQAHGEQSRARQYIDRATQNKHAKIADLRKAATLLGQQGDYRAAVALLEHAYASEKQLPPDLILAMLYRRLNQRDKVEKICQRLLEKPDGDSIAFCADFYAALGRLDDARHCLEKLDTIALAPGEKELILAGYTARFGSTAETMGHLRAATQAAPTKIGYWQKLVSYCLMIGEDNQALKAADDAVTAIPAAKDFNALRESASLIRESQKVPGARQLVMSLGQTPESAGPLIDALQLLVTGARSGELSSDTVGKLRPIADHNPRNLALQTVVLQLYLDCGEMDDAARMAARTAQTFPTAIEPVRAETGVFGTAHRWDEALSAAKEWKRRDPADALDADQAIATAELQLGDTTSANDLVQLHLEQAIREPEKFSGILMLRSRGLLALHHPELVESLLGPLLEKSPRVRQIWLTLILHGIDDPKLAHTWMEKVVAAVSNNPEEQTALADGWINLGNRWSNTADLEKGRALVTQITQAPAAPAGAFLLLGIDFERNKNLGQAETNYRRAIELAPKNAVALNNLASVMVQRHENMEQAKQFVDRALEHNHQQPAFLDTKASIQAAQKDFTGAIATLQTAQHADPTNFKWRINLLEILVDKNDMKSAKSEMRQIDGLLPTFSVSPELRERYTAICQRIR